MPPGICAKRDHSPGNQRCREVGAATACQYGGQPDCQENGGGAFANNAEPIGNRRQGEEDRSLLAKSVGVTGKTLKPAERLVCRWREPRDVESDETCKKPGQEI